MRLEEYQEKSMRTLNNDLTKEQAVNNMILGIVGETGEVVDIIKKHYYQGHELDLEHIKEEIGDIMFYMVNLCNYLGLELEEVIEGNYNKLMKRYPEGFSKDKSINRN